MPNFKLIKKECDRSWFLNEFLCGELTTSSSAINICAHYKKITSNPALTDLNGVPMPLVLPQWLMDDFRLGYLYDIATDIYSYIERFQANTVLISIDQPHSVFDAIERSLNSYNYNEKKYAYYAYRAIINHSVKFDPLKNKSIDNFFALMKEDYNFIDSIVEANGFSSIREYFNCIIGNNTNDQKTLKEIFEEKKLEVGLDLKKYNYYIVDHLNEEYFMAHDKNKISGHPFFKNCSDISRLENILYELHDMILSDVFVDGIIYQVTFNSHMMDNTITSVCSKKGGEFELKMETNPSWLSDYKNLQAKKPVSVGMPASVSDIFFTQDRLDFMDTFRHLFQEHDDDNRKALYMSFCSFSKASRITKNEISLPVEMTKEMKTFFKTKSILNNNFIPDQLAAIYKIFAENFGSPEK